MNYKVCLESFAQHDNVDQHLIGNRTREKPFSCKLCPKSFKTKPGLDYHNKTHSGEMPYDCTTCSKSFPRGCDLNRHQKTHIIGRKFHCYTCSKSFKSKQGLDYHHNKHIQDAHLKEKTSDLVKSTNQENDRLQKNLSMHDDVTSSSITDQVTCNICSIVFTRDELKKHELETHAGISDKKIHACRILSRNKRSNLPRLSD